MTPRERTDELLATYTRQKAFDNPVNLDELIVRAIEEAVTEEREFIASILCDTYAAGADGSPFDDGPGRAMAARFIAKRIRERK